MESYSYRVIDNVLPSSSASSIRSELLGHYAWKKKNHINKHLHNFRPEIPQVKDLNEMILSKFKDELKGLSLLSWWAMLNTKNSEGNVHADYASMTFTYWLTDDCHCIDKSRGGLRLYDFRASDHDGIGEYLTSVAAREKVLSNSVRCIEYIPYRFNRGILFDSKIYHEIDRPMFNLSRPEGCRMNLTFAYDTPERIDRASRNNLLAPGIR